MDNPMGDGKLYRFMEELAQAGCSPQFVCEQGYQFAITLQRERARIIEPVSTRWMELAATWVGAAALALGIHPTQLEAAMTRSGGTRRR